MTNLSPKLNIFFPIETEKRELDYKLFLACMVARKNNNIYIGQHDYIFNMAKHMTGGIYVGKNLFTVGTDGVWRSEKYYKLNQNKIRMIHLDEEGGIIPGGKKEWNNFFARRIDTDAIKHDDYICTWGEFQNRYYQSKTVLDENHVLTTGHPRFDLPGNKYREFYRDEVNEVKNKYGGFVLINTNVGLANGSLSIRDTFSPRWGFKENEPDKQKILLSRWAYMSKTLAEYIKMVFSLCVSYPETHFVLRPHPSEDSTLYNAVFDKMSNVTIESSGSVIPWLLASKLMIHDTCTTAVEGYMADVNIINYRPFYDEDSDSLVANSVGKQCDNIEDLHSAVHDVINDGKKITSDLTQNQIALSLLYNLDKTREYDSFEMCSKLILDCQDKMDTGTKVDYISMYKDSLSRSLVNYAKNIVRPLFREKHKEYLAFQSYFPGFNKNVIDAKLKNIQNILGKDINYKYVNKNLLVISV